MDGDLTIRNVTCPVTVELRYLGWTRDPAGVERASLRVRAEVDREDSPSWNAMLQGGGLVVGRTDARLFFSSDGERAPARQAREQQAEAICAHCLVVAICAAYAVAAPEWYGIWGGLSEADRRRIWQHTDQADLPWRYRRALAAWDTTRVSGSGGASVAG